MTKTHSMHGDVFMMLLIRIPKYHSWRDWPERISTTADFLKPSLTAPSLYKKSDLSHLVGSSGDWILNNLGMMLRFQRTRMLVKIWLMMFYIISNRGMVWTEAIFFLRVQLLLHKTICKHWQTHVLLPAYRGSDPCSPTPIYRSCKSHDVVKIARLTSKAPSVVETSEDLQPLSKHMRTEWPSKSFLLKMRALQYWFL